MIKTPLFIDTKTVLENKTKCFVVVVVVCFVLF